MLLIEPAIKNRNGIWCQVLLQSMVDAGVNYLIYSTGGRSACLCLTADSFSKIRTIPVIDERTGAFIALGMAKSLRRPIAIVSTSGSAVANLLPALTEAYATRAPLLLLTCDRPRTTIALQPMQYTKQAELCRPLVHRQLLLEDPMVDSAALSDLYNQVFALATSLADDPAPAHINIPQWGQACSTEPEPLDTSFSLTGLNKSGQSIDQRSAAEIPLGKISEYTGDRGHKKQAQGLIICGPEATDVSPDVVEVLTHSLNYPVLADACSGLRLPSLSNLVTRADFLVRQGQFNPRDVDIILRFGGYPVSPAMQRFLQHTDCPVFRIGKYHGGADILSPHAESIGLQSQADVNQLVSGLLPADPDWLANWLSADSECNQAKSHMITNILPWGELQAVFLIGQNTNTPVRHFGNSLPVRLANLVWPPMSGRVFSNRGTNGIDGTMSTFLGELVALGKPGLALIGDQSFLHDLNALAHPEWKNVRATICVINNKGAGIFDFISASQQPRYEEVMRNQPLGNISAIAASFGAYYHCAEDPESLNSALRCATEMTGLVLIEINVPARSALRDIFLLEAGIFENS